MQFSNILYAIFLYSLGLLLCPQSINAQKPGTLFITDTELESKEISQFLTILVDRTQQLTIEEILALDSLSFMELERIEEKISFPAVLWMKLEVVNEKSTTHSAVLGFCHLADSISLYEVQSGQLERSSYNGQAYEPSEKEFPSVNHNLAISLPPNNTKHLYIRTYFSKEVTHRHLAELFLRDVKVTIHELIDRYTGQAFYAGLMLMFGLLSFFTFLMFRDLGFVYFGMVHLAFALYFTAANDAFSFLVYNVPFSFKLVHWSISLLILALSIFVSQYLKLQQKHKKYYTFYVALTLFVCFNKHLHFLFFQDDRLSVIINNIGIMLWIITTMIPVVRLARSGDKSGTNLLISLSLLVLSSIVYLLALMEILPLNFFTKNSIQICTVLFSLLVFYRLFEIVKEINVEKQQAISLNELKSKFFTNISHEFRTPLTLIMGPLRQLLDQSADGKDTRLLQGALKNTNRLLNMVNQLLDLSRAENKHLRLDLEKNNYVSFLKGLVMSFESLAEIKQIEISFESNCNQLELWYDIEKMELIFFNLLSNAFKYTSEGGKVSLIIKEEDERVEVLIQDTGSGIADDELPYVFDRFFRVENTGEDGSGIGLSLAKELVELHHGEIGVESRLGEGTIFSVQFQKGNAHFQRDVLVNDGFSEAQEPFLHSTVDMGLLQENTESGHLIEEGKRSMVHTKPNVLLVEDNKDVRQYLKEQLAEQFQLLEATNGQEGFELAIKHMPELVISDVMMPVMDGMELCTQLKQDVRTSHIPVILLTAKAEKEDRLEGLELGADEYLTKPFHTRELNIRVRKLIELRIQLRKKLLESPMLSIKQLEGNPVENRFVEKVYSCIETHLANPQFGVEMLAEQIGISRSQLNRKLKAITDRSANKYIQHIRLQKALSLLETENINVSEVAFQTGFNSVAYFVKCFREHFGKTPGSFQKKNMIHKSLITSYV